MKTLEEAVERLNTIAECDKEALLKLLNFRVPVNEKLADHPTCQVSNYRPEDKETGYSMSLLGVLNGIFGEEDRTGPIVLLIEDNVNDITEDFKILDFNKFEVNKKYLEDE